VQVLVWLERKAPSSDHDEAGKIREETEDEVGGEDGKVARNAEFPAEDRNISGH